MDGKRLELCHQFSDVKQSVLQIVEQRCPLYFCQGSFVSLGYTVAAAA